MGQLLIDCDKDQIIETIQLKEEKKENKETGINLSKLKENEYKVDHQVSKKSNPSLSSYGLNKAHHMIAFTFWLTIISSLSSIFFF